jgi:hypothetical protein
MVVLESSYETRARFVSLVCSGWSLNRAAAELGLTSAWSVKWWRRLAPMNSNRVWAEVAGWRCWRGW